jgi:hypothetical protein
MSMAVPGMMLVSRHQHAGADAMDRFIMQHREKIVGTLSCFDRVIFKGHLPINYALGLERFLDGFGLLLKDFKSFATSVSDRLVENAKEIAARSGREYRYLNGPTRKEELARQLAEECGVERGLVCVLSTLEPVQSFRIVSGEGRPRLMADRRKCLVHYFYLLDPIFGFMHVRRQTWFPFTMQVYVNGHDWLACRMKRLRLRFEQLANSFVSIARPERAQHLAREFARLDWPSILHGYAHRFNPLMGDLLEGMQYHWVTDQAEFATDVMFRDRAALEGLYPELVKHAITSFSSEDVMRFLGKKLHPSFAGELVSDVKRRPEGVRVGHRVKANWIKMYDKHGQVLRVETVINKPKEFKVRRVTRSQGVVSARWTPMPKGVAFLDRTERIAAAANRRYLDGLVGIPDQTQARKALDRMAVRTPGNARSHRGFNPADPEDARLFKAVLGGQHVIAGFRNRDVRAALLGLDDDPAVAKRHAARVTRLLNRLHAHGYVAKIPRTHRWRVTELGRAAMSAVIEVRETAFPAAFAKAAA